MHSDRGVFVHNRIGLLTAMNYGSSTSRESGTVEAVPPRLPSPVTDNEEDNGYKSWERGSGSTGQASPPEVSSSTRNDSVFMPPPASPTVLKRERAKLATYTPAGKSRRCVLVTSTPNMQAVSKARVCSELPAGADQSLNWDCKSDEGHFSQHSNSGVTENRFTQCCDKELCQCQHQLKFSFAINCDDANSVNCSSAASENASVSSDNEIQFDEDEKVLSGDRLSQMTRTYHDIEAVTHLLEEKERDLELAARIGQTLLQKNREITQRNEQLEEQLAGALEEVSQLRHEISLKEDLLHTYADDETDSSGAPSPVKELRTFGRAGMINHIENLQTKIKKLEDESSQLKLEQMKYQTENEAMESQEQQIVSDAFKELYTLRDELKEARENNRMLSEELSQRNEEAIRQQEEITRLLTQIVDMQRKQKQLALENEELQQHLTAANNTQYELTREIQSLEDRYQEVTNMLDETREEARLLRDCPEQYGRSVPFSDSLAAELECSGGFATELHLQESQPLNLYNATPIDWSSLPSSVIDGETTEDERSPSYADKAKGVLMNRIIRSEPRARRMDNLSQRVLNTAKFVNSVKNYSMNSRFQYATPRKLDRPIPTPLPIPGSNRSPCFVHHSPDSTPSSGRCMSSTPHSRHRMPHIPTSRHTPLRLQLAKIHLAKTANSVNSTVKSPNNLVLDKPPSRLNRSTSALASSKESDADIKRAERTWHGESLDAFANDDGLATPSLGRPGIPGTEDLERAIRKLALRRESARYMEMERRLAMNDESFSALCNSGTITPGSMPSGGRTPPPSCPGSPKSAAKRQIRTRTSMTPKLRIVKPLEGSITLNQWKNLAERDRTLPALQTRSDIPSGIITRDRVHEVLSRSKESSFSNISITEPRERPTSSLSDAVEKVALTQDDSLLSPENFSLADVKSSSPQKTETTQNSNFDVRDCAKKEPLALSPICPGKGFALTSTRYTFTNSTVMNPSDVAHTKPICSTKVQATVYCNTRTTSTRLATSVSNSTRSKKDPHSYLSNIHPFLTGQSKSSDKVKQTKLAEKFFEESTRTCSMQLGLAHLFKEHSVNGLAKENGCQPQLANSSQNTCDDLDSPTLPDGEKSAFTLPVSRSQHSSNSASHSHIVWNRSLQRTFLLPSSVPSRNLFINLSRRSDSKKPETPPNSPLTSVPSSASFLLNEILAETTQSEALQEKKEDSTFSSNLISKLAQIGLVGLQGFRSTKTSVSTATSHSKSLKTRPTTSLKPRMSSISKCATAPGSLLTRDLASMEGGEFQHLLLKRPSASPDDEGIIMKPTNTDWGELHGSSGALNVTEGATAVVNDGYLDEVEGATASSMGETLQNTDLKSVTETTTQKNLEKSKKCDKSRSKTSTRPKSRPAKKR